MALIHEKLEEMIRRRRYSKAEVERRLGLGRNYLSDLLRDRKDLKWKHVTGILAVLGIPEAEFFAELYSLPSPTSSAEDLPVDREEVRRWVHTFVVEEVDAVLKSRPSGQVGGSHGKGAKRRPKGR